nr:hypothetical protein [uncultured Carboxylicivirga sp.]
MKTISHIILFFFPLIVFGQDYPRIDTVSYGKSISHVNHYFHYDDKNEKLISSYWFNDFGKHYITYSGYEDDRQKVTIYEYNNRNEITNIKGDTFISPKNDSITTLFYKAYEESYKKGKRDNNTYNELYNKYSSMYEVVNPENLEWDLNEKLPGLIIHKNKLGLDSLIELYDDFNKEDRYLDEKVYFFYNSNNKLARKKWVDIKNPNVFEFQAFKPSSTELDDSLRMITGTTREKKYKYYNDSTEIKYYVNGVYTGYEIKKYSNNGLKLEELVFNAKKDTLSYFIKCYNSRKLLQSETRVKHNGYNGFGYAMDLVWGDTKRYAYDPSGRLIRIDGYEGNKHISVDRFEIIEK